MWPCLSAPLAVHLYSSLSGFIEVVPPCYDTRCCQCFTGPHFSFRPSTLSSSLLLFIPFLSHQSLGLTFHFFLAAHLTVSALSPTLGFTSKEICRKQSCSAKTSEFGLVFFFFFFQKSYWTELSHFKGIAHGFHISYALSIYIPKTENSSC